MASDESYAPDKDASYSLSSEADDEAGDRPKQRKRPAPGRGGRGGRGGGNAGRTAVPGRGQRGRGGGREQAAPGPGARGQRGGSRGQRGGRGGGQEVAPSPAGRGQTAGRGGESAGPSERRSGRGSRGRRGGRDEAEEERVQRLQTERRVQTEALIQQMGEGELRELTTQLFSREPGLVFDALLTLGNTPTPPPAAALPWCTCGNCREMTTDLERKCCGQGPNHCISQLPHFNLYCLEDGYLRLHRQYRNDVWVVGDAREPGDDNREFRYAAYRQYIFWQHGALGQGNRRVIPSCCVWRIRDKYPDPLGQYTGFVPTI